MFGASLRLMWKVVKATGQASWRSTWTTFWYRLRMMQLKQHWPLLPRSGLLLTSRRCRKRANLWSTVALKLKLDLKETDFWSPSECMRRRWSRSGGLKRRLTLHISSPVKRMKILGSPFKPPTSRLPRAWLARCYGWQQGPDLTWRWVSPRCADWLQKIQDGR